MSTWKIQYRSRGLRRYRAVRVNGGKSVGPIYEFFTLSGARRWIATLDWHDIPTSPSHPKAMNTRAKEQA